MKRIFIQILFQFLFIFIVYSEETSPLTVSENFKKIITLDDDDKKLIEFINRDDLNYKIFFYYYCFVSEEIERLDSFLQWFEVLNEEINKEIGSINIKFLDLEKQKKISEKLLFILHSKIFKKYLFDANRISLLIERGEFNCVSSSIIYTIFLLKYGFNVVCVRTIDHAFVKIIFEEEQIDVETTNKYGFDPGKDKKIIDEFGRITGFTYVPQNNYKDRQDINIKKLLILIYHNLLNAYFNNENFIKASNLAYIIYIINNDEASKNDFITSFKNYLAYLFNKNKFEEAVSDVNSYFNYFGQNEILIDDRFNILGSYVNYWNDFSNIEIFNEYLLGENNRFQNLKNNVKFIEIYMLFIYKCISNFDNFNNFNNSYRMIKDFNKLFTHNDINELFKKIVIDELDSYKNKNNFKDLKDRCEKIKYEFPEYSNIVIEYKKYYLLNWTYDLLIKQDFTLALSEAKLLYEEYPFDDKVRIRFKECFAKISIYYFEKNDLEQVIKYSEEGLSYFPKDTLLENNYLTFFKNLFNESLNKKDYQKAEEILNIALKKFPDDAYLNRAKTELNKN